MMLAGRISKEIRALVRKHEDEDFSDWSMSSVWRYGENAEKDLLQRMYDAPCPPRIDPLLFAQRFILKHGQIDSDGTRRYSGVLRQPRKIDISKRLGTSF